MNTTYFADLVMGNVFGSSKDLSLPSDYYVGLSSTMPQRDGAGVTEPVSTSYRRVRLSSMSIPVNGEVRNDMDIMFPESTDDWGKMVCLVIFDAETGGNLLIYNPLLKPRTVEPDTVIKLKPGSLTIGLNCE